ncbi:MAG: aminoacyl-histidine dipeptidase [Clostridiaceae bacterium]
MGVLSGINNKKYLEFFEGLTRIPRGSGNEQKVSDHLVQFAVDRGLEYVRDEANNVIIFKKGTAGYENSQTVILQGHMDMVNEKNNDTVHDFENDPLKLRIIDDFIYADGTTLGADNGIAVAYAMAILHSEDIPHPPLEVLITTEEETGLKGATSLKKGLLKGTRLINIDSEEEGILIAGCAGGARVTHTMPVVYEKALGQQVKISVTGLTGGHSGMDIDKIKGNSIKILGRVLYEISSLYPINVVSVQGGSKMNAIPREAMAVISINPNSKSQIENLVEKINFDIKNEIFTGDSGLKITCKYTDETEKQIDLQTSSRLLRFLMLIPSGVESMSPDIEGLVMTSTNLGVMDTENDSVVFQSAVRSSMGSSKKNLLDVLSVLAKSFGTGFEISSEYPQWEYSKTSELREKSKEVYKKLTGKELEVKVLHAGLECGILSEKTTDCDMISIGPDLYDVHTPNEHISISSSERTYDFVLELLKELK